MRCLGWAATLGAPRCLSVVTAQRVSRSILERLGLPLQDSTPMPGASRHTHASIAGRAGGNVSVNQRMATPAVMIAVRHSAAESGSHDAGGVAGSSASKPRR